MRKGCNNREHAEWQCDNRMSDDVASRGLSQSNALEQQVKRDCQGDMRNDDWTNEQGLEHRCQRTLPAHNCITCTKANYSTGDCREESNPSAECGGTHPLCGLEEGSKPLPRKSSWRKCDVIRFTESHWQNDEDRHHEKAQYQINIGIEEQIAGIHALPPIIRLNLKTRPKISETAITRSVSMPTKAAAKGQSSVSRSCWEISVAIIISFGDPNNEGVMK